MIQNVRTRERILEALLEKTKTVDNCWIFTGTKVNNGYGLAYYKDSRMMSVHRLSYAIFYDFNLNSKELILHKNECISRACWNPMHLYIGDHSLNAWDKNQKYQSRRGSLGFTHCPHGHEYTKANTYVNPKGYRICIICKRRHNASSRRS